MSFRTMDGVEVYDKHDVDLIKDSIDATTSQHTTDIQQLNQSKADKTYAQETRQLATDAKNEIGMDDRHGLKGRVGALEDTSRETTRRVQNLENHSATVEQLNQGLNTKADKTYAEQTRQIANNNHSDIVTLQDRADNIEETKADKSEIPALVSTAIDSMINGKLASIESDVNHIVDNAIDDELEDYDNAATTSQKTASAINDALTNYDDKAGVDQKINDAIEAAVATRPVAMTADEVTSLIDQYF